MQFLRIGNHEFNVGRIVKIDFDPYWEYDWENEYIKEKFGQVDFEENMVAKIPIPRARVYLCGEENPIETRNAESIAYLETLWNNRLLQALD